MFLTRSEYDRGVNTFSPEGRLLQVEYALEAIKLGSTALAIKTSEGVVLASEKRIPSTLMVSDSMEKITKVADHVGCTASGLIGDSRILIEKARAEAANHFFVYDYPIKIESVALSVSNLALQFGDDDAKAAMSRPFGVAILFAGYDKSGAHV
uniref:Proteasome subunit alpha type n=1 Tax=Romanomermis culicivorax TaxID=13658 RepID=A0A915IFC8_ROMCU